MYESNQPLYRVTLTAFVRAADAEHAANEAAQRVARRDVAVVEDSAVMVETAEGREVAHPAACGAVHVDADRITYDGYQYGREVDTR